MDSFQKLVNSGGLIMSRVWVVACFIAAWVFSAILAVTWGFMFDWPDYVHVNYGVPLVWATHTLNTIAGPVDKWNVDLLALIIDLLFGWDQC